MLAIFYNVLPEGLALYVRNLVHIPADELGVRVCRDDPRGVAGKDIEIAPLELAIGTVELFQGLVRTIAQ